MQMSSDVAEFVERAPVARLATVNQDSTPHLVPVVYVLDSGRIVVPLDSKKKSVQPDQLKRVRNIRSNPSVCILVDEYHDDWKKLRFVMMNGKARIGQWSEEGLVHIRAKLELKYPQYKTFDPGEFCIVITLHNVVTWKSDNGD